MYGLNRFFFLLAGGGSDAGNCLYRVSGHFIRAMAHGDTGEMSIKSINEGIQTSKAERPVSVNMLVDSPRMEDYVAPWFFFSSRTGAEVVSVSPSVKGVLGFETDEILRESFANLLCHDCPLNADFADCEQQALGEGRVIRALRSVRNRAGDRRVLFVSTVGVVDQNGTREVRRHSTAWDVTDEVCIHALNLRRLRTLNQAEAKLDYQELQVARLIVQGKMNRELSKQFNISERTVDRRRSSIMRKLGVSTGSEMVARIVERETLEIIVNAAGRSTWANASNVHQVGDAIQLNLFRIDEQASCGSPHESIAVDQTTIS